jgi:hypothetical protein
MFVLRIKTTRILHTIRSDFVVKYVLTVVNTIAIVL